LPEQAINKASANQKLSEVFAPWVQQLNLQVTSINGSEVELLMPYNPDLCRAGGIVCGQSLMALNGQLTYAVINTPS